MRCDPVMMAELGGPLPRDGIAAKVARDVAEAAADREWIMMILPDPADDDVVAGSVVLWSHADPDLAAPGDAAPEPLSEIGWMVLPEFQGQGLGREATRLLLNRAAADGRWGAAVHAFPGVSNTASNGICRSLGFALVGQEVVTFNGRRLPTNHWVIDPAATGRAANATT